MILIKECLHCGREFSDMYRNFCSSKHDAQNSKVSFCINYTPNRQTFATLECILESFELLMLTFIYVPIRPSRRDPEADELEDSEE